MRFTTASGTTYELINVERVDDIAGEWSAHLIRDGVPVRNVYTGGEMATLHAQTIWFHVLPTLGASFCYWSETHAGVISTPVVSFELTDGEQVDA